MLYVAKCQTRKRDTLDPYCLSYVFQKRKRHWTWRTTFKVPLCFFRMVALITKALEWLVTIISDPVLRHTITFGTTIRMKPAVAQRVSILLLWRQWFTYGLWYTDRKSIVGAILQGRTNLFPFLCNFRCSDDWKSTKYKNRHPFFLPVWTIWTNNKSSQLYVFELLFGL